MVVKHSAVSMMAWYAKTAAKGVCFRLRDGTQKNAFCDRSGKHKLRLAYTSFVTLTGDATVLGGDARRGETTADATKLVSLVAKNSKGVTVETITVSPSPTPGPVPPNPCPPCPGPPMQQPG